MSSSGNKIMFSIVIPIMEVNDYLIETCKKFRGLHNQNFEVIVVANKINEVEKWERELQVRIIPLGDVSPAIKRDKGVEEARGGYIAFVDDDAYPDSDWLDVAEKYLEQENISIIGGPQLTPSSDGFWQKASGAMFLSPLSGAAVIRFWPGKKVKKICDWPTVNFFIKREDFQAVGGFDNEYWPGEDTKLCLDVIKKLKKKLLYIPELVVYHHRRASLKKHLKQTGNYGLHRGYFAKRFPETSARLVDLYFVPSLFILFLVLGFFGSFFSEVIKSLYIFGLIVYAIVVLLSTLVVWQRTKNFLISLASVPYLVLFHIWYGIRFIQGYVFTRDLKSRLGR